MLSSKIRSLLSAPADVLWFDLLGNPKDELKGLFQVLAITIVFWGLLLYLVFKRKWGLVVGMIGLALMAFFRRNPSASVQNSTPNDGNIG